jgi:thiamine-phosphate pyrophosphorylase
LPKFAKSINRIIDANINRAKEGLRVCEEITRFILDDRALTARLKAVRHKIGALLQALPRPEELIKGRSAPGDVGRGIYGNELKRKDYRDIFFANIQRVKESIRVLEEFVKLENIKAAVAFKGLRYSVYHLEKKAMDRFSSSSCRR